MAFIEMKIHSDSLGHGVSVNVIIPQYAETIIGKDYRLWRLGRVLERTG